MRVSRVRLNGFRFTKVSSVVVWGFSIFETGKNYILKKVGGRGDHTRIFIAHTRRSAQFSLGKANLIHPTNLASDFLRKFHLHIPMSVFAQTSLLPTG